MNKNIFLITFLFVALVSMTNVQAAIVHGTVYTMELDPAIDAIVKVNTEPQQMFVTKDGVYSFEIPTGEYVIEAEFTENHKNYIATENITIKDDGDYVLDLLLFPDLSEELDIIDEEIDFSDVFEDEPQEDYLFTIIIVAIILVIIVISYMFHRTRKVKGKPKKETDISDQVLEFIKNEGGRTTQKEIRKQFPFSEAKISLVMAELEDKGIIKKIRKGRGNVIVLED